MDKGNTVNNDEMQTVEKMTVDQVLTNLKVISQIQKGEKIVTNNIIMEIDNRYFKFARRWWAEDSRISTYTLKCNENCLRIDE